MGSKQANKKVNWFDRFLGKEAPELATITKEVLEGFSRMQNRMPIPTEFEHLSVDFNVTDEWTQIVEDLANGVIFIRTHYNTTNVKCVHNKWADQAWLKHHYHELADEYIYVTQGTLLIETFDRVGNKLTVHKLNAMDNTQPYFIPRGVPHFIQAIDGEVDFVVKFVTD